MRKLARLFVFLALLTGSSSCLIKETPKATSSDLLVTRGDVIVTSFTSDSLVVFAPDGSFKRVLYTLANSADSITGITWNANTNEVLIAVDGSPDRIEAVSVINGTSRNFYLNATLYTGTLLAIAQLKNSEDIVASESTTIERFSSSGQRETYTTVWPTNAHANSQQILALASGQWLSCSSTAGLRLMDDSTTSTAAVATATSGIAATTACYGAGELSDGTIVISWSGTTDSIQTYTSSLTGATTIYTNTGVLGDPRGIAIGEGDEIYVADGTRNVIVEIDASTGSVVREFGAAYLQSPRTLIVVPQFN